MRINELSKDERQKILDAINADGFSVIDNSTSLISFKKGMRTFELRSLDIEDGLTTDFDFEKFMDSNYILKSRHSISYSDKFFESGSIEESCKKLGWQITKGPFIVSHSKDWNVDLFISSITEVLINDKLHHTIVDNDVYTGKSSELIYMGTVKIKDLLSGTNFWQCIQELKDS